MTTLIIAFHDIQFSRFADDGYAFPAVSSPAFGGRPVLTPILYMKTAYISINTRVFGAFLLHSSKNEAKMQHIAIAHGAVFELAQKIVTPSCTEKIKKDAAAKKQKRVLQRRRKCGIILGVKKRPAKWGRKEQ